MHKLILKPSFFLPFIISFILGLFIQYGYSHKFSDSWTRLIHNNDDSTLGRLVTEDFLPYKIANGTTYDGIYYYVIARDPFCQTNLCIAGKNDPKETGMKKRFKRIIYPLLSGAFGNLSPMQTLWGLILVCNFGISLTFSIIFYYILKYNLSILNSAAFYFIPGVYDCLILLTTDGLALGLGSLGIFLFTESSLTASLMVLCLTMLTKEAYYLIPFSLGAYLFLQKKFKTAALFILIPPLPFLAWLYYIEHVMGLTKGEHASDDICFPFTGILTFLSNFTFDRWSYFIHGFLGIILIVVAGYFSLISRSRLLKLLSITWIGLALILSDWIWRQTSDASRVLVPLWIFTFAMILERKLRRS